MADPKDNYKLYIENAHEMLEVAGENLDNNHYGSACNRAYYAVFYAASALLYSKGKSYGKHSAVLAAFRQYFIKTEEFDKKWSDDYEFVMDNRQTADYELHDDIEKEDAIKSVAKAKQFIEEVKNGCSNTTCSKNTICYRVVSKRKKSGSGIYYNSSLGLWREDSTRRIVWLQS